jgi:hypothetical protein
MRFGNWITTLLLTSYSCVVLTGLSGKRISHRRGHRQGGPLSPLLFDLVIDPLQQHLDMVKANEDLHRLRGCGPNVCTSLGADDAAFFVALYEEDFDAVAAILDGFEEVTS